jgi:hypothetical protein
MISPVVLERPDFSPLIVFSQLFVWLSGFSVHFSPLIDKYSEPPREQTRKDEKWTEKQRNQTISGEPRHQTISGEKLTGKPRRQTISVALNICHHLSVFHHLSSGYVVFLSIFHH